MKLALFDLDQTLLDSDSELEWSRFLVSRGLESMRGIETFFEDYRRGELNFDDYFAFQMRPHLSESPARMARLLSEFLADHITPLLRRWMLAVLRKHRLRGHRPVLISAAHDFVAEPIASICGFKECIVTQGKRSDGRYTGRMAGLPCFQGGKLSRLRDWIDAHLTGPEELEETWFYSDSLNDLPLLEWVDHPVAVTPDDTLRSIAGSRGWTILDGASRAPEAAGQRDSIASTSSE